jgi:hypothetical protein
MSEPYDVFLDHYQTERFGLYWRHYPNIGLDAGLFYNFLLYDVVNLDAEYFYPDAVRKAHRWGDAFEDFHRLGVIHFPNDPDRVERSIDATFLGDSRLNSRNLKDAFEYNFEDVLDFDFCVRNRVPFCISPRLAPNIDQIAAIAHEVFAYGDEPTCIQDDVQGRRAIAQWLFELEVPALTVRNERMQRKLLGYRSSRIAKNELQQQWFISPEELVEILSDRGIGEVREEVVSLAERVATRSELGDAIKEEHETLEKRIVLSNWTFQVINLALTWIPFSEVAAAPSQLGVNYLVRRKFEWLYSMIRLNKRIRNREHRRNQAETESAGERPWWRRLFGG